MRKHECEVEAKYLIFSFVNKKGKFIFVKTKSTDSQILHYVISLKWDSVRDAFHRVDCIFGYQELASFQGESPIACLRCKTISRDLHLKRSLLKILPCALPPKGWKTAWSNRLSLWTLTMRAQSSSGFGHWLNLIWSFQPKLIQDDSLHSEVSFLPYCIKKCILPLYGFTIC